MKYLHQPPPLEIVKAVWQLNWSHLFIYKLVYKASRIALVRLIATICSSTAWGVGLYMAILGYPFDNAAGIAITAYLLFFVAVIILCAIDYAWQEHRKNVVVRQVRKCGYGFNRLALADALQELNIKW